MPRFVILHHQMPPESDKPSHWDFMLEAANGLETWALPAEPLGQQEQIAEQLPLHRIEYLTYEGPVSGNRGRVVRWDRGEYEEGEYEEGEISDTPPTLHPPKTQVKRDHMKARRKFDGFSYANDMVEDSSYNDFHQGKNLLMVHI